MAAGALRGPGAGRRLPRQPRGCLSSPTTRLPKFSHAFASWRGARAAEKKGLGRASESEGVVSTSSSSSSSAEPERRQDPPPARDGSYSLASFLQEKSRAGETMLPELPRGDTSVGPDDDSSPSPSPSGLDIPYQCAEDVSGLSLDELCRSSAVYNPEISWLAFNWRVLALACSDRIPLLERLTFLSITASNLDEFFAKRVGGLKKQLEASKADKLRAEEEGGLTWTPDEQLELIAENVKRLSRSQDEILRERLEPRLAEEARLRIVHNVNELSARERERLSRYFTQELELLLTPIKLDPGHPFPFLQSLSIGLAVRLRGEEEGATSYAVVAIPSTVARWIPVKVEAQAEEAEGREGGAGGGSHAFLPVEELIASHLDQLFGGWKILGAWPYRVTRNAELERHEEECEDLLEMMAEEVRERMFAPFVRLEVRAGAPADLVDLLTEELELNATRDVYHVESLLDLSDLRTLAPEAEASANALRFPRHQPVEACARQACDPARGGEESIFDAIRKQDILVHHPYESFESSTLRLLEESASDPNVLAIKTTVYRTSNDSPVIKALMKAAEARKEVAVLMELKARFDEERNVSYAQELEAAGCSVAYGLIGLKTHCKVMLVVRREVSAREALRTYVHIGTGNYNPVTAGLYSDFSLFSCDPQLGRDATDVFKHLTGMHKQEAVGGYRKLLVAQVYMRDQIAEMIDGEIEACRRGGRGAILLKVNGLDDRLLVRKLYEAARAGVRVDCVVRGMCRLRPGVMGLTENVRVVSVLGRFLEHHRVAVFHNGGDPKYFIGSADWMARNLSRRVEVAAPVGDERIKETLRDVMSSYLSDMVDAWEMLPDGTYVQPPTRTAEAGLNACLVQGGAGLPEETSRIMERSARAGTQSALVEYYSEEK